MSIKRLVREEIESEMTELSNIEVGTNEYEKSVNGICKLVDKAIEFEKMENEQQSQVEKRELDADLKREELEMERKDRRVKNGITLVGVLGSIGVTVWGTCKTLKFEELGSVTSLIGKGWINKIIPKK